MDSVVEFISLIVIILIIFCILIITGVKIFSKSKKYGFIYLIVTISVLFILFNIKVKTVWFFKDYNIEHKSLERLVSGTWTNVYKLSNTKVLKQISAPGVSHQNFSHVALPSIDRKCYKHSCSIPVMLAHKYTTNIMWRSLKRIHSGVLKDCKYFPKIYKMDEKKRYYIQEYVPLELKKETCPLNITEQLQDLNNILLKHNLFLDDVHSQNWRVTHDGLLKIIDCEVYTSVEKEIQQTLLDIIDGSQQGKAKGHVNASNILHWNDGRPNINIICNNK